MSELKNKTNTQSQNSEENHHIQLAIETTKSTLKNLNQLLQVRQIDFLKKENSTSLNGLKKLTDEENDLYQKILCHRVEYYKLNAPHLLLADEVQIESDVDQRSAVFAILKDNEVLCSLRLTEKPFELENFNIHEFDISQFAKYLEIGRLVSASTLDPIVLSLIVRYLLCAAGLWAIEEFNCHGFVAICRPFRVKFFNKFGLKDLASFYSNQRKINYHFLAASMNEILLATSLLQKSESALRRRIQNSFQEKIDTKESSV